jgi:hypothetical protein
LRAEPWAGSVAFKGRGQHGPQLPGCFEAAQFVHDGFGAQQARHAGQRLEMIGASAGRRQQHDDKIDRLVIDRIELDRLVQPGEQGNDLIKAGDLAMGNGDAIAQAGRPQLFTAGDRSEDVVGRMPGQFRRSRSKLLKQLAFRLHASATKHCALNQNIGQFH